MIKFLKYVCVLIAYCISVVLAGGLLSPYSQLADSLAHFRLHICVLLALAILCLFVFRAWRNGVALFFIFLTAVMTIDFSADVSKIEGGKEFKLMQLNLYFKNRSPTEVIKYISRVKPDVIAFQEVSKNTRTILSRLKRLYPYQTECPFAGVGGVAVISKFPFSEGQTGCAKNKGLVWGRVKVGEQEITVASLHLHWPYPFGQYQQITSLEKHFEGLKHPVILAGDFNAAPWSHAVSRINRAVGTEAIGGIRFTVKKIFGYAWLSLPIDHVLISKQFKVRDIYTGPQIGSDHLPVIVRLDLRSSL